MDLRICAILCLFAFSANAAPAGIPEEFKRCQDNYDIIIGHLVASSGMGATNTVWRLIFHSLDLDGNDQVTSSEIALFFEKEDYVHETDIMDVILQAASWISVADGGDDQLSREEFVTAVQKTVGQKTDATTNAPYSEVSSCMCKLFTIKVPHLSETMSELSVCTTSLETAILEDESKRAEFNSWTAIFKTMDADHDMKIDFQELKHIITDPLVEDDDIAIASAVSHAIYGTLYHDVHDITEKHFYVFVHELLYGLKGKARANAWEDVTSEQELHGRTLICKTIRSVRSKLTRQRNAMDDCIKSYKTTRQSILGADGVFAPEIVFTMADADRNGEISQHEFDTFIGSSSYLYHTLQRSHDALTMKIKNFRSVMPDEIVVAKERGNFNAVLESSAMSSPELDDAEKLCSAITAAVQKYPVGGTPNHDENRHVDHMLDMSGSMSFMGQGEHIMVEHTLPPEEPTSTPSVQPATAQSSDSIWEGTPIVYHIMGADGVPFELSLSHAEIDDITHRIAMAQEPPQEPTDQNTHEVVSTEPTSETPSEHESPPTGTPSAEETELVERIEHMLHQQQQQQKSENEEESELKELLEAMEGAKTKTEPETDTQT